MADSPSTKGRRLVLVICYVGFISLGLPDTLIGVAWPSVRETFRLRQSDVSWIFIGSGASYFLSSFFAGRFLKAMNVGVLLALSSALVAISGFNYALATVWLLFALGALFHGLGSGAIDSGLNHYVANHFSARHMNWLHACYSVGAMLGPIVMTAMITRANSWRSGYGLVGTTLLALAFLFMLTRRSWDEHHSPSSGKRSELTPVAQVSLKVAFGHPIVWLHIGLFFIYTGLEVALGQWSYTVLTEGRNEPKATAGAWVTIYWASILAGRIAFGFIVDRIRIDRLIRWSTVAACAGAVLFAWKPSMAPFALGLSGVGLAVIFPCL